MTDCSKETDPDASPSTLTPDRLQPPYPILSSTSSNALPRPEVRFFQYHATQKLAHVRLLHTFTLTADLHK